MKNTFLLLIILLSSNFLFSQNLRLEESEWVTTFNCRSCFFCECISCPVKSGGFFDDASKEHYEDVPIKEETQKIKAFCGGKLIGTWTLRRYNDCKGGYNYANDIKYLKTRNGYIENPNQKVFTSGGFISMKKIIQEDAKQYCLAGEKRKNEQEIINLLMENTMKKAGIFPTSNLTEEDIWNSSWYDLKKSRDYEFRKDGRAIRGNWRGEWLLNTKKQIEITWKFISNHNPKKQIISISEQQGKYKFFSILEGDIHAGEMLKIYGMDSLGVIRKTKQYMSLGKEMDMSMREFKSCDVCYWENKTYPLDAVVEHQSVVYDKNISFTCSIVNQKMQWISELSDNAYYGTIPTDLCIVCRTGGMSDEINSPGYYSDGRIYSGSRRGQTSSKLCTVYKNEDGKFRPKFLYNDKIAKAEEIAYEDFSFSKEKVQGKWNVRLDITHRMNTYKGVKKKYTSKLFLKLNLIINDNTISGTITSNKSGMVNMPINGKLAGNQFDILVQGRYAKFNFKGEFLSKVKLKGAWETIENSGKKWMDTAYWGNATGSIK